MYRYPINEERSMIMAQSTVITTKSMPAGEVYVTTIPVPPEPKETTDEHTEKACEVKISHDPGFRLTSLHLEPVYSDTDEFDVMLLSDPIGSTTTDADPNFHFDMLVISDLPWEDELYVTATYFVVPM
jgi:hypothetical protein